MPFCVNVLQYRYPYTAVETMSAISRFNFTVSGYIHYTYTILFFFGDNLSINDVFGSSRLTRESFKPDVG